MKFSVEIVAKDNGRGLSRDSEILRKTLEGMGASVDRTRRYWDPGIADYMSEMPRRSRYDLCFMLESVDSDAANRAKIRVYIPNPEFASANEMSCLARSVDIIWAKSRHAEKLFTGWGGPVVYGGFTSLDLYSEPALGTAREEFLHLAGSARSAKNTGPLIEAWLRHPEWPHLTVVRTPRPGEELAVVSQRRNLSVVDEFLPTESVRELQHRSLYHIYPSAAEGWGHAIGEAMSVGAVVLTTDAPPMNEIVTSARGILLRSRASGRQMGASALQEFDVDHLEEVVEKLARGSIATERLRANARDWFLENDRRFHERLASLLDSVGNNEEFLRSES